MAEEKKIAGKTQNGFEFVIEGDAMDDIELLEDLAELDNGNLRVLTDTINRLLGEEQKKKLYDHCRNENGVAKASEIFAAIQEIFDVASEGEDLKK
ncbi:hypothetical protein [Aminicella lysinilytica]|uniref:Uncharacterized protein n=1 Tax=Aminicella lysinilytica TaxID=433323 RepID=A0A4R6QC65_9FIRM|nr:hypothetical protein [Aminicella lysinilytica]TDP59850.1 hypothetical protein EV211_10292 [Aminicella lysinilytica]